MKTSAGSESSSKLWGIYHLDREYASAGKRNRNYQETEEHKIKPHVLRNLRDHECVLIHCERGFRRVTLRPLEPDGSISPWFPRWRRILS